MNLTKLGLGIIAMSALFLAGPLTTRAATSGICVVPSAKFSTIAQAVNKPKCKNITIAAGTFHEHNLTVSHDVVINGSSTAGTIVDGDNQPIFYIGYPTVNFSISNLTLQHSANNGGALALDTDVTANVTSVMFLNNALALWMEGGTLNLNSSTFKGNSSTTTGAAFFRDGNGGAVNIDSTKFINNTAACGAAIYTATDSHNTNLFIRHSQFKKNTATADECNGGALNLQDPTTITGNKFVKNKVTGGNGSGGAIGHTQNGLSIDTSTFSSNSAESGGAIADYATPQLNLNDNTFDHNSATVGDGGAIYTNSTTYIANNTFYSNSAVGDGGGIAVFGSGATISFATFSNNTAAAGGNLMVGGTLIELKNSILNQGSSGNCYSGGGTFTSYGSNISSDASCSAYLTQSTDKNSTDPLIGALAKNGGPTQTQALLDGSPAIDGAADCNNVATGVITHDQRGITRPQGPKCDLGAYEKE